MPRPSPVPRLGKDIEHPGGCTLRLGQDGASPPRHLPPPSPGAKPCPAAAGQFPVAEASSTLTPGPIVEEIETFLR